MKINKEQNIMNNKRSSKVNQFLKMKQIAQNWDEKKQGALGPGPN